jgi:hypothetical protein
MHDHRHTRRSAYARREGCPTYLFVFEFLLHDSNRVLLLDRHAPQFAADHNTKREETRERTRSVRRERSTAESSDSRYPCRVLTFSSIAVLLGAGPGAAAGAADYSNEADDEQPNDRQDGGRNMKADRSVDEREKEAERRVQHTASVRTYHAGWCGWLGALHTGQRTTTKLAQNWKNGMLGSN